MPGSQVTSSSGIPGDESALHPALLGAARRRGRVGAREASATLVHLIGCGAVTARTVIVPMRSWGREVDRQTTEIRLVPGVASGKHTRGGGPQVRQGHIEGLTRIDRELLSLLFDRVAHCEHLTLAQLDEFSTRNPWSYWSALKSWRDLVADTARDKGLLRGGSHALKRRDLWRLKSEVRRSISAFGSGVELNLADGAAMRLAELAVVFGLERSLVRSLRFPPGSPSDMSPSAGVESARWLLGSQAAASPPIVGFTRSFAPFYASGYPPAQHAGVVMSTHGTGASAGMSGGGGGGGGFSSGGGAGGGGGGGGAG